MALSQSFPLTGMSCGSCVKKITARLLEHSDICEAVVSLDPPEANITARSAFSDDTMNEWLKHIGAYRVAHEPDVPPAKKVRPTARCWSCSAISCSSLPPSA